jgi:hypothetical protein
MRVHRIATLVVLVAILAAPERVANASLLITITQVGSDVVATASGTINITDLILLPLDRGAEIGIAPARAYVMEGVPGTGLGDVYGGFIGPLAFGPGGGQDPTSGSGDSVGMIAGDGELVVPSSYVSGTRLSATDTYSNQTFSSLGLTPGTYTWTWGTGANADSVTVQIVAASVVPEPSTAVLAVIGAGSVIARVLVRPSWSQRRQAAA